jgi:hypothetical protein
LFAEWALSDAKLLTLFGDPVVPSGGDGQQATPFTFEASVSADVEKLTTADVTVSGGASTSIDAPLAPGDTTVVDVQVTGGLGAVNYYKLAIWRDPVLTGLEELLDSLALLISHDLFKGYTADSVDKVESAMADGRALVDQASRSHVTQADVDAARKSILDAVAALDETASAGSADAASLQLLIAAVKKLDSGSFTSESLAAVKAKVAAAQKVLATSPNDAAKVTKATDELLAALAGLRAHYVAAVRTQVKSVSVAKGKSFQLAGLGYLESGVTQAVSYTSSNPKIAKVSSAGKITGVKTGTATVTATSRAVGKAGKKLSVKVKVKVVAKAKAVKKVSAKYAKSLPVGGTTQVVASWQPASATPTQVVFSSSNWQVAKVDRTGQVKAIAAGVVKIHVRAGSVRKSFTIRVGSVAGSTPKVTGVAKVGRTLKAVVGSWSPTGVKLSYQWFRDGKRIAGATKATYKLSLADKGKKLKVKVTGKLSGYKSTTMTSKPTAAIQG